MLDEATAPDVGRHQTSTTDGILRRPEVDPAFLKDMTWDRRWQYSYVPPPAAELRLPPQRPDGFRIGRQII